jgi:hypothetical protein
MEEGSVMLVRMTSAFMHLPRETESPLCIFADSICMFHLYVRRFASAAPFLRMPTHIHFLRPLCTPHRP